jgi:hypothetical protein
LGRWPYPPEKKIQNLSRELSEIKSLHHRQTVFFDQEGIYVWLPRSQITSPAFRFLHRFLKFEPYLRVFELVRV